MALHSLGFADNSSCLRSRPREGIAQYFVARWIKEISSLPVRVDSIWPIITLDLRLFDVSFQESREKQIKWSWHLCCVAWWNRSPYRYLAAGACLIWHLSEQSKLYHHVVLPASGSGGIQISAPASLFSYQQRTFRGRFAFALLTSVVSLTQLCFRGYLRGMYRWLSFNCISSLCLFDTLCFNDVDFIVF